METRIQVQEANDADMYRIFEICSFAFAENEPFFSVSWPRHATEVGRLQGAERFQKIKNTDPHNVFLKAIDPATQTIIGMAKWMIYTNNTIPDFDKHDETDYWHDDEERAFAKELSADFLVQRNAAIVRSGGNLVSLDILAIDPAHQRRGAGARLVEWGLKKADELGVESVVESSVFGRGLYEKHGFVFVEDVELKVSERFADREKQGFAWMTREKKG